MRVGFDKMVALVSYFRLHVTSLTRFVVGPVAVVVVVVVVIVVVVVVVVVWVAGVFIL